MSVKLLSQFLKQPVTIVGIITLLLFQIFFSLIWITGYDRVTDRVDRMSIAIVNEDGPAAQSIADGIAHALDFDIKRTLSLQEAQNALENRTIQMIITIPQGFTGLISTPSGKPEMRYILNDSNPQMVSNVMHIVASRVTAVLNTETIAKSLNLTLQGMHIPTDQAEIIKASVSERITSDLQIIHPTNNFVQLMIPLMIITAAFTGGMFLCMNLHKASSNLALQASKWQRLGARFTIIGTTALITSLIGVSMIHWLGIQFTNSFITVWLFEFIVLIACMLLAQLSLLLFGEAGAWLNIALLSAQMLASGATIPRYLLSPFYKGIGQFLPAYYAVDGALDLVVGGTGVWNDIFALLYISAAAVMLGVFLTIFHKERRVA